MLDDAMSAYSSKEWTLKDSASPVYEHNTQLDISDAISLADFERFSTPPESFAFFYFQNVLFAVAKPFKSLKMLTRLSVLGPPQKASKLKICKNSTFLQISTSPTTFPSQKIQGPRTDVPPCFSMTSMDTSFEDGRSRSSHRSTACLQHTKKWTKWLPLPKLKLPLRLLSAAMLLLVSWIWVPSLALSLKRWHLGDGLP